LLFPPTASTDTTTTSVNENDIRPLKPLELTQFDPRISWIYFTIGLAAIGGIGVWAFLRHRRKSSGTAVKQAPDTSYDLSMSLTLKKLEQETNRSIEKSCSTLSMLFKGFLETKFHIQTRTLTTQEIASTLADRNLKNMTALVSCLEQVDQARYAGRPPSRKHLHRMIAQVQQTIESLSGEMARE
jgi:hypothetical protein